MREGLVVEAEVEAVHAREEEGGRVLVEARVQVLRRDVVAAAGDERECLEQRLDGVLGLVRVRVRVRVKVRVRVRVRVRLGLGLGRWLGHVPRLLAVRVLHPYP